MISPAPAPMRRLGIALAAMLARPSVAIAAALALAAPAAFAQGEPAVTKKATELRETPDAAGRTLAALPAQTAVQRTAERKGPWVQVKTEAGQTGWVHLFDVGPASGAANTAGGGSSAGNVLRNVGGLFSRAPAPTATSASGVRGLEAHDIANAQPNLEALGRVDGMRLDENQARDFANAAALSAVNVDPLPAPSRPGAGGRPGGSPGNPDSQ